MDTLYKTSTAAYWQDFTPDDEGMDQIYELVLSTGKPHTVAALVRHVVAGRCDNEARKIAARRKKGAPYQPADSYSVGQRLSFAALDHRQGEVIGVRLGKNPRYGPFEVIDVQMENPDERREFASMFSAEHALNLPVGTEEETPRADELAKQYGHYVWAPLVNALQVNPEFICYDDQWLLQGLLLDIHEGHLNIAEAMIDVASTPLPPKEIVKELDLPETGDPALSTFSLNYALDRDDRFVNEGTAEEPLWNLRRLTQGSEGGVLWPG